MKESFGSLHRRLDSIILGVMAVDTDADVIHGLGGSIVICDSPDAMRDWLIAHDLDTDAEIEFVLYGCAMASMCEDAVSYHMADPVSKRFLDAINQDQRFHPEILHYSGDGWTMFLSTFDPLNDPLEELRALINAFRIGYLEENERYPKVVGLAETPGLLELTYEDFERLTFSHESLDELAAGKLRCLSPWIAMLNTDDFEV